MYVCVYITDPAYCVCVCVYLSVCKKVCETMYVTVCESVCESVSL